MFSGVTPAAASACPAAPPRSWAIRQQVLGGDVLVLQSLGLAAGPARTPPPGARPAYWPAAPHLRDAGQLGLARRGSPPAARPACPGRADHAVLLGEQGQQQVLGLDGLVLVLGGKASAACTASRAFTVNLSNLRAIVLYPKVAARVVAAQRLQFFVELVLRRRQVGRHDDLRRHELVAGAAALEPRHPVARQPEAPAARRARRDLHGDLATQSGHLDGGAERGLGRGDGQVR